MAMRDAATWFNRRLFRTRWRRCVAALALLSLAVYGGALWLRWPELPRKFYAIEDIGDGDESTVLTRELDRAEDSAAGTFNDAEYDYVLKCSDNAFVVAYREYKLCGQKDRQTPLGEDDIAAFKVKVDHDYDEHRREILQALLRAIPIAVAAFLALLATALVVRWVLGGERASSP